MMYMTSTSSLHVHGENTTHFIDADDNARYHIYFVFDGENERVQGCDTSAMMFLKTRVAQLGTQLNAGVDPVLLLRPYEMIQSCFHQRISEEFRRDHPFSTSACSYAGVILDRQEMQLYIIHLGNVRCMLYENKQHTAKAHNLLVTKPHSTQETKERRLCEANGLTIIKKPCTPHTLYGSQITRIFGDNEGSTLLSRARQVLGSSPDITVIDLAHHKKRSSELSCLLATTALFDQMSTEAILRAKMLRSATPEQLANMMAQVISIQELTMLKLKIGFLPPQPPQA